MYDDNRVRYLGPGEATKRALEVQGMKRDRTFSVSQEGYLKVAKEEKGKPAELSSTILLQFALRRRGLAMEMADLISFETHEEMVAELFAAHLREPITGFARVSQEQMLRADQYAFERMSNATQAGIRRDAEDTRPMDTALKLILVSPGWYAHLQNLPAGRGSGGAGAGKGDKGDGDGEGKSISAKKRAAKAAKKAAEKKPAKGGGKKGGGDGDGSARGSQRMPAGLIGGIAVTADGRRVCFGYNLGTCPESSTVQPGQQCKKGFHICCKPSCGKDHTFKDHA